MPKLNGNQSNGDTNWPTAAVIIVLALVFVALVYLLALKGTW
jgi:hypothetical protein